MNIIANIPGAIKMLSCLRHLQPDKKHIEAARAAGNYEEAGSTGTGAPSYAKGRHAHAACFPEG